MKQLLIALVAFLPAVCLADEPAKPIFLFEIAPIISHQLPTGWRCISDRDCILILRDEPVNLLGKMNAPDDAPGQKAQFMIVLEFRPRLSEDEYANLVALRTAALQKIRNDPTIDIMDRITLSFDAMDKFPIPEFFNSRFSIFVHRSDEDDMKVRPDSAAKECDAVSGILAKLFDSYPVLARTVSTTRP